MFKTDCLSDYIVAALSFLEQFSTECSKTKTKVITLTNHNRHRQSTKPIRTCSNTGSRHQAWENACKQVVIERTESSELFGRKN